MKNKYLSLFFIIFLLSIFCINGLAFANDNSISISEVNAGPGSSDVLIDVNIDNSTSINGLSLEIYYDNLASELTYKGYQAILSGSWNVNEYESGKILALWNSSDNNNLDVEGSIIKLKFDVSESSTGGKLNVKFNSIKGGSFPEEKVKFIGKNGGVNIRTLNAGASDVDMAYTGQPQSITVTVTEPESGYTIMYGTTEGTYNLTEDNKPSITNVSDSPLTVYYKVTADGYAPATGSAAVTISPKEITAISGLKAKEKVYDGTTDAEYDSSVTPTFEGMVSGDTLSVAVGSAAFDDKNAGTDKKVTFSGLTLGGTSVGNYTLTPDYTSTEGTGSITKKAVTVSGLTAAEKVYDGTTNATADTTGVTFTGKVGEDNLSLIANAAFTDADAGTGKAVTFSGFELRGDDAGNYSLSATTAEGTGTITQRAITITANNQTTALNGNISQDVSQVIVTGTNDPVLAPGQSLSSIKLTPSSTAAATTSGTITPSNALIITDEETTAKNYAITYEPGTLTVNKADPEVNAPVPVDGLSYTGTEQSIVSEGSTTGGTLQYSLDDTIWSTAVPKGINAGDYTVYYRVVGDANYNDVPAQSVPVSIAKAALEVTAKDHTITYGDAPTNNGVDYSSFAGSDNESSLSGSLAYDYSYSQYGNVGNNYTITPSGVTSDNYEIEFKPGTLTVEQKEVGLTWSTDPLTFDGSEQAPTATATELVNGDAVNVTVSGKQTNAGVNYTAAASALSGEKADNYKLPAANTQAFSIAKAAAPTLTDVSKNVAYTAASVNASLSAVGMPDNAGTRTYTPGTVSMTGSVAVSGFVVDSNGNVTANLSGSAVNDTITLPVTISSTNYEDSAVNVNVTIVDKENANPVLNPEGSLTKTYGDAAFTMTVSAMNPGTGTGIWTWSSSNPAVATVTSGSTEATVTILSAGTTTIKAEYSSDTTEGDDSLELTVNQKEITVSGITANNKEYDTTTDAVLNVSDAVLTGKVETDDLSVTATGAFADKNAETGKTVNISDLTLTGTAVANYKLAANGQQTAATADITAKSTTVSGITAADRDYSEGTTTVTLSGGAVDGILGNDTVSVDLSEAAGTMTDDKAGTGKTVTVTGVKLSGTDAANYTLSAQPTGVTVTINKINWTNTTAVGEAKYGSTNATVDLSAYIAEGGTIGTITVQDASSVLSGMPAVTSGTMSYSLVNDVNLVGSSAVVTVPVNGATNYNDYTIAVTLSVKDKDAQTIEASDITLTYGETKNIGASVTVGDGALSYQVSSGFVNAAVDPTTGAVTGTNVGTAVVTISASETNEYLLTTKDITVTVEKADITESDITKPDAIPGLGYTGQDQELIAAGNAAAVGTMQYAIGQDAQTAPSTWSDTIPTGNAAGTYYVWVKVTGDANHNDYVAFAVEVKISAKPMTVDADDVTVLYDGMPHGITVKVIDPADGYTVKYGTEEGVYDLDQSPTITEVSDSPLKVYYQVTAENYDPYTGSASVIIKGVKAHANDVIVSQDGQPHGITVIVDEPTEGYTIKYGTAEGVYNLDQSPTITDMSESPLTVYYEVTAEGYGPYRGSAMVIFKETMKLNVKFVNVQSTGTPSSPMDIKEETLKNITVQIKNGDEAAAAVLDLPISGGKRDFTVENVEFSEKLTAQDTPYTVSVTGLPREISKNLPGFPTVAGQGYSLSANADAWYSDKDTITITLFWTDKTVKSEPEIIRIYALPEDEVGAYSLREDGTKEYLLFHTYDICMQWLGSDELCRGYERCFHKESPYEHPFAKSGLIEEIRINP